MNQLPLTRRSLLTATLTAPSLALLAACASGTRAQQAAARSSATTGATSVSGSGLSIGLTYTPNIQFAPFYLAQDGGLLGANTLRHHGAEEGLFDALLSGTEQLVVAGGDEAIVAASNGNELVIIGGFYQRYPVAVITREDSDIKDLPSLKGHSIGLPGHYGENWFALQLALQNAGLSDQDVDIREIGYTQQLALSTNKVDAIIGYSNNDAVQLRQAGTAVREISIGEQVPLLGASLITSRTALSAHREELKTLVAACAQGMTRFCDDADAAVEATKSRQPDLVDSTQAAAAKEVAVATAKLIRPASRTTVGALVPEQVGETIDFLSSHQLLGPTAVTTDAVCDALLTVG
ncbi:ABC-type taurine transport system, periplasmic component [Actinomyces bovis]|uniref:ABC-type taurine transport system, periplasmic component n=1 Tax=Actinomyces bovis TaxID=1658 RepID=A0ABY1VQ19_9ACTO|nr:ABC transporter substrate-binding protein [Actinomyces bovis]SPT54024.1 ABC-type taurine transport system, periplasmic component [Actinomyces bovis]VEG53834.1 ABC-type taurine transport system, periplasmic component [Actinomyces israelii]